jgi:hypothetical protein
LSLNDVKDIAAGYIKSGSMLPQTDIATSGSTLVKVVPKGDAVSATTGFWMNIQQAQAVALMTPEQARCVAQESANGQGKKFAREGASVA